MKVTLTRKWFKHQSTRSKVHVLKCKRCGRK